MNNLLDDGNERPSTAVSTDPSDPMQGLDPCGGIGRLKYLLLQIFLIFTLGLGSLAFDAMSLPINYAQPIGLILIFGWMICGGWVTVQRYKNLGYPGYYFFMFLVPIANLYYSVLLSIGPEGYAIHKTGDRWTKIVLGFFLVMFILSIFAPLLITALERRPL